MLFVSFFFTLYKLLTDFCSVIANLYVSLSVNVKLKTRLLHHVCEILCDYVLSECFASAMVNHLHNVFQAMVNQLRQRQLLHCVHHHCIYKNHHFPHVHFLLYAHKFLLLCAMFLQLWKPNDCVTVILILNETCCVPVMRYVNDCVCDYERQKIILKLKYLFSTYFSIYHKFVIKIFTQQFKFYFGWQVNMSYIAGCQKRCFISKIIFFRQLQIFDCQMAVKLKFVSYS